VLCNQQSCSGIKLERGSSESSPSCVNSLQNLGTETYALFQTDNVNNKKKKIRRKIEISNKSTTRKLLHSTESKLHSLAMVREL